MGIDIQDDQGRHEVGMVENTIKTPLGLGQEGCLFESVFHINKVTNCSVPPKEFCNRGRGLSAAI